MIKNQWENLARLSGLITQKADGTIKGRCVVDGREPRDENQFHYAPTPDKDIAIMLLNYAAYHQLQLRIKDGTAAYCNVPYDGPITPHADGLLLEIILELKPEWQEFVSTKNRIYFKLHKALYMA